MGQPPDLRAVVERTLCLRIITRRGLGEDLFADEEIDLESLEGAVSELDQWLREEGLWEALSKEELALVRVPPGSWPLEARAAVSWRAECIGVLVWALGLVAKPSTPSEVFMADTQYELIPVLMPPQSLFDRSALRSPTLLERERELAEVWLWRSTTERILRDPDREAMRLLSGAGLPPDEVFRAHIRKAAANPAIESIGEDFAFEGQPFGALDDARFSLVDSILRQRLYAHNWLSGQEADWDEIRTDT